MLPAQLATLWHRPTHPPSTPDPTLLARGPVPPLPSLPPPPPPSHTSAAKRLPSCWKSATTGCSQALVSSTVLRTLLTCTPSRRCTPLREGAAGGGVWREGRVCVCACVCCPGTRWWWGRLWHGQLLARRCISAAKEAACGGVRERSVVSSGGGGGRQHAAQHDPRLACTRCT
jgi:hypothetical protein